MDNLDKAALHLIAAGRALQAYAGNVGDKPPVPPSPSLQLDHTPTLDQPAKLLPIAGPIIGMTIQLTFTPVSPPQNSDGGEILYIRGPRAYRDSPALLRYRREASGLRVTFGPGLVDSDKVKAAIPGELKTLGVEYNIIVSFRLDRGMLTVFHMGEYSYKYPTDSLTSLDNVTVQAGGDNAWLGARINVHDIQVVRG